MKKTAVKFTPIASSSGSSVYIPIHTTHYTFKKMVSPYRKHDKNYYVLIAQRTAIPSSFIGICMPCRSPIKISTLAVGQPNKRLSSIRICCSIKREGVRTYRNVQSEIERAQRSASRLYVCLRQSSVPYRPKRTRQRVQRQRERLQWQRL